MVTSLCFGMSVFAALPLLMYLMAFFFSPRSGDAIILVDLGEETCMLLDDGPGFPSSCPNEMGGKDDLAMMAIALCSCRTWHMGGESGWSRLGPR